MEQALMGGEQWGTQETTRLLVLRWQNERHQGAALQPGCRPQRPVQPTAAMIKGCCSWEGAGHMCSRSGKTELRLLAHQFQVWPQSLSSYLSFTSAHLWLLWPLSSVQALTENHYLETLAMKNFYKTCNLLTYHKKLHYICQWEQRLSC